MLGFVLLEPPHAWGTEWHEAGHTDPEGATRLAAVRAAIGAVVGAVIGGALVGLIAAAMGGGNTGLAGAVVGAFTGAVLGAIICVFAGLGGSTAYTDTFVDAKDSHVCLVSLHTNDRDEAKAARTRLSGSAVGGPLRCRRERQDEAALTWHALCGRDRSASDS